MDRSTLNQRALSLRKNGFVQRALEIHLFLCDEGPAVDAGWYAVQIAESYEALGRIVEARYWASRAVEQDPTLPDRQELRRRLGRTEPEDLIDGTTSISWSSDVTAADQKVTREILMTIPGGEALVEHLDRRTTFHDSEVIALELDRGGDSKLVIALGGIGGQGRVTLHLSDWIDA